MTDPTEALTREDAYIEIMLLMAFADGTLQEEEATLLANTVAHRDEFGNLSEQELADAVSRALDRLQGAPSRERLLALRQHLPSEEDRFKATVFAYSILVADGVVAPGETRCLLEIQEAFGLALSAHQAARPARQRRAEVTRARLLQAGLRLFEAEGFHATSSKKIAREAGVAIGSFYNYFQDKKALFLELFQERALAQQQRALEEAGALNVESDPRRLCRLLVSLVETLLAEAEEFHREKLVLRSSESEVRALFEEETARLADLVAAALAAHREQLRVEDPSGAARVVVTVLEETLSRYRLGGALSAEDPRLTELADLVHRYLFR